MHSGKTFNFGGTEFVVPPLSLGQARRFEAQLEEISAAKGISALSKAIPVIHAAITRNYPDMTEEDVAGLVGAGRQFRDVWLAVMGVEDEGEPKPARPTIGAPSTGALSPQPAGATST